MTDPTSTVPSHRMDAATARRSILMQHARIRALLAHSRAVAERALDQQALFPEDVAHAIGDIHTALEAHLRFEEMVLMNIFNDDLPLGPVRAARLRDEHTRQRATVAGLHEEAKAAPFVPLLGAKLAFLATWLLNDMDEEERTMLTPDVLRDDLVAVDQSDG
ncbi:MAG: hypothetical protein JWM82_59 [Myxococcales bacterium]|nr:hypothetical protein [Myxococcales bacterium]